MLYLKDEKGRTLVEMIGVLGLIGLLTVGAMTWYGDSISQMQANDLLSEVRKRALGAVSQEKTGLRNRFTEGMFNKQESGRAGLTGKSAYGYGVGDNTSGVMKNGSITYVPVGKLNNGNALTKNVCEALLKAVKEADETPKIGDVTGIYRYNNGECTRNKLNACEGDSEGAELPDVICVGIKS